MKNIDDLDKLKIELFQDEYKYVREIIIMHFKNQFTILSAYITVLIGVYTIIIKSEFNLETNYYTTFILFLAIFIFGIFSCLLWSDQVHRQLKCGVLSYEIENKVREILFKQEYIDDRIFSLEKDIHRMDSNKWIQRLYYIFILIMFSITTSMPLFMLFKIAFNLNINKVYFLFILVFISALIICFTIVMFTYLKELIKNKNKIN